MGKVVFISGTTVGDALGETGRTRRAILENLGHEFIEVNCAKEDALQHLQSVINGGSIDFVFSFAGMLADLTVNAPDGTSRGAWQALGIPFLTLHGDTPAYFFDRHIAPGPTVANIYIFPEHYRLRRTLPKVSGILGTAPLHSCSPVPLADMDVPAKKDGKILFLKNGNDPARLLKGWRESLPPRLSGWLIELAEFLVERISSPVSNDIDGLVSRYFQNQGIDIEQATRLRLLFIAQLDDYLRRVKSAMMAEALLDFPIEVHGVNWEHVDFQGRRARLIPRADYALSQELIKGSLAVLDMSPNTELLPHDRTVRSFDLNTLCLTNEQRFFQENFARHADFSFRFEAESLQRAVADVLANPARYVDLGVDLAADFKQRYPAEAWGRYLEDVAALIVVDNATGIPNGQDFFAWPPRGLQP